MKTIKLFFLLAPAFFACTNLHAQVTVGGLTDPAPGALLDLNSTVRGGLLLSNVTLPDLTTIPNNGIDAFPGVNPTNHEAAKSQFKGAIVYHTGGNDIAAGVYVWNGRWWTPADGTPVNTVKDAQGNEYSTGYFGEAAGWWMTQNLRSTQYDDEIGTTLMVGGSTNVTLNYPGPTGTNLEEREAIFDTHKEYGLLYSWAAASGRIDDSDDSDNGGRPGYGAIPPTTGQYYQGICPHDWHLPSDYEWSQLEKEIATNPSKYSEQTEAYGNLTDSTVFFDATIWDYRPDSSTEITYWGRQMKRMAGDENKINEIDPNGSSKSRQEGGFDAFPVGYGIGIGSVYNYGSNAFFWSSSSYGANGVRRSLGSGLAGVYRNNNPKSYLFSVRCKKD
jgi:uncharacterized protein (TIGR02145 family)